MGEPEPLGPDALRYLADAEAALDGAAPDERQEILAALREHIALWCRDVGLNPEHCPYEELVAELGPPASLAEHGPEPAQRAAGAGIPAIPRPSDEPAWDPWNRTGDVHPLPGGLAAAGRDPLPHRPLVRAEAWGRRAVAAGAAALLRWLPRGQGAGSCGALALRLRRAPAAMRASAAAARGAWAGLRERLGAALPGPVPRPVRIAVTAGVPAAALVLALAVAHPWGSPAARPAEASQLGAAAASQEPTAPPPAFAPHVLPPAPGGNGQPELASLTAAATLAENQVSAAEQRLLAAQRQEGTVEAEMGSANAGQVAVRRAQAEVTAIADAKAQVQAVVQAAAQALRQDMARQAGLEATLVSPDGLTAAPAGSGPGSLPAQVQSVEASVWHDASLLETAEQREGQLQSELAAAALAEQQALQRAGLLQAQLADQRTRAQAQVQAAAAALAKAQEQAAAEAAVRQASLACAQANAVAVAARGPAGQAGSSGTAAPPANGSC